MKPFRMALPRTVEEAAGAGGESFAASKMLAGGTDLLAELKERTQTPDLVINLKRVAALRGIAESPRGLEIGALVTLAEAAEDARIAERWPALRDTILETATPQIRNAGTVGGNLAQRPRCWYYRDESYRCLKKGGTVCYAQEGANEYHAIFGNKICAAVHPSNLAPVLIAHGALVEIAGSGGKTRTIPVEEFFVAPEKNVAAENVLAPQEVIARVILPLNSANRHAAYVEARERLSYDWALCGATASLRLEAGRVREARIVLNAVAPVPVRRKDLEAMLIGAEITDELLERVAKAAAAGATPLRDNGYKQALAGALTKRAILAARAGKGAG
ncbi:MAG: FAD binding domain-containing protein [Planctomycetes bacterium]|nr:FAD binding domain-containing protein [Planctomycetota bacterium]